MYASPGAFLNVFVSVLVCFLCIVCGRPRLRREYCVKRDVRKAGEEEDWKKNTIDRGGWKRLSYEAVNTLRAAPHPCIGGKEEEREKERECDVFFLFSHFVTHIKNTVADPDVFFVRCYHNISLDGPLIQWHVC